MNIKNSLLALLCLALGNIAHAETTLQACSIDQQSLQKEQIQSFDLCKNVLGAHPLLDGEAGSSGTLSGIGYSTARCFKGIGDGIYDAVKGVAQFAKLLVVDAPSWAWNKFTDKIIAAWENNDDPIDALEDTSSENLKAHKSIMEKARGYWNEYSAAIKALPAQISQIIEKEWQEFNCLPASVQSEVICKLVSEVFMTVVTPYKVVKGSKWAVDLGKALNSTVKAIRSTELMQRGSVIQGIERIGLAISEGAQALKTGNILRRMGESRLVEYIDSTGEKIVKFERKVNGAWVARELVIDVDTGFILAKTTRGTAAIEEIVKHAAKDSGKVKSAAVVIDLNNLGKVNYFQGNQIAGDRYIRAVAEAVKKTVRSDDILARIGGDEFMVMLDKVSSKEAKEIMEKIVKAVHESPEARNLFTAQRKYMAEQYRAVNRAKSLEDLGADAAKYLSKDELDTAKKNFDLFRKKYLSSKRQAIDEVSHLSPSVSIGTAMVRQGDTAEKLIERASNQAAKVKVKYKAALGQDVSKYGGTALDTQNKARKVNRNILPEVEAPLE